MKITLKYRLSIIICSIILTGVLAWAIFTFDDSKWNGGKIFLFIIFVLYGITIAPSFVRLNFTYYGIKPDNPYAPSFAKWFFLSFIAAPICGIGLYFLPQEKLYLFDVNFTKEKIKETVDDSKYVVELIKELFNMKEEEININVNYYFCCEIKYKGFAIMIYTTNDYKCGQYFDIEYKKDQPDDEYSYHLTPLWIALAYNDELKFNHTFDKNDVKLYLAKLKEYINNNKLVYDYTTKDYSKRYYFVAGVIKEMPLEFTDKDFDYAFEDKANLINGFRN